MKKVVIILILMSTIFGCTILSVEEPVYEKITNKPDLCTITLKGVINKSEMPFKTFTFRETNFRWFNVYNGFTYENGVYKISSNGSKSFYNQYFKVISSLGDNSFIVSNPTGNGAFDRKIYHLTIISSKDYSSSIFDGDRFTTQSFFTIKDDKPFVYTTAIGARSTIQRSYLLEEIPDFEKLEQNRVLWCDSEGVAWRKP